MTGKTQRALRAAGSLFLLLVLLSACQTRQQKEAGFLAAGQKDLEAGKYASAILRFRIAERLAPEDADPHYYLGLAYWGTGDLGAAASELTAATQRNASHTLARTKLAELAVRFGSGDALVGAERQVQQILAQSPNNADAWYTLAIAEWRLGKPEDAFEHLRQALAKMPQHLDSSVALARMQVERHDFPAAEKTMLQAAEKAPNSVETAIAVGRFYLVAGKTAEAEKQFRRALGLNPDSGAALLALGETQMAMGNRQQAERTFAQIATLRDKTYRGVYPSFLIEEKRYGEAIPRLQQLVRENPNDHTLRGYLVRAYVATGGLDEAQKLLAGALARDKSDLDASLQQTEILLRTNHVKEAESALAFVMRSHANLAQAHVLLAGVYEAKHDARNQQRELTEALRLSPDLLSARVRLARSLLATGNAKLALAILDQAPEPQKKSPDLLLLRNWALLSLQQWPKLQQELDSALATSRTPELLLQDGLLKFQLKQYADAVASFQEALRANPQDVVTIRALARTYVAQNRLDLAETLIAESAARYPKSPQLQVFIGGWMASTGRLDKARAAYALAKAADPNYVAADLALARVATMERKWDEARGILTPLCSGEAAAAAHMQLAQIDEQTGAKDSAIEHYRKVIEEDPQNLAALNNLAYLLADNPTQIDEGIGYAKQALGLVPSPGLYDTLGWLYYRKGAFEEAVQYLERAVAAEGTAVRRYHLAMAYFMTGDTARGQAVLKVALGMNPNLPEARVALEVQAVNGTTRTPGRGH
jgi:tetratricopeptide (TPR) repeat protein